MASVSRSINSYCYTFPSHVILAVDDRYINQRRVHDPRSSKMETELSNGLITATVQTVRKVRVIYECEYSWAELRNIRAPEAALCATDLMPLSWLLMSGLSTQINMVASLGPHIPEAQKASSPSGCVKARLGREEPQGTARLGPPRGGDL